MSEDLLCIVLKKAGYTVFFKYLQETIKNKNSQEPYKHK